MFWGIVSGLAAGALWGLVYLIPKILSDYSAADIAIGRYFFGAVVSIAYLAINRKKMTPLVTGKNIKAALLYGLLSYSLYYLVLVVAIQKSGPVPPTLIIGLLPIVIPILSHDKVLNRKLFFVSLTLILSGLVALNLPALWTQPDTFHSSMDWIEGILLSFFSLILWTVYALKNAKFLSANRKMDSFTWSSFLSLSAFVTILPMWLALEKTVSFNTLPHFLTLKYLLWMAFTGIASSWLANYFWNHASRHIPTALAGQLIVSETVFSLLYCYLYDWRLPTMSEFIASLLMVAGVIMGIHSFYKPHIKADA